jgi:hypothetical protein
MNQPYVKQYKDVEKSYTKKGETVKFTVKELSNPITKDKPYLHSDFSTGAKKAMKKESKNNKKGIRLVVTNVGKGVFTKYKLHKQLIPISSRKNRVIHHSISI